MSLKIKNLTTKVNSTTKLLNKVSLEAKAGELVVLVGPNGSGKSTLSYVVAGHPDYESTGEIIFKSERHKAKAVDLIDLTPEDRANLGIFLAFQTPEEVEGVSFLEVMRLIINNRRSKKDKVNQFNFRKQVIELSKKVGLKNFKPYRDLNVGFSGGEKKKAEILQMLLLDPEVIILDEPDSGLDIDSIDNLANIINEEKKKNKTIILISHHKDLLSKVDIDALYILKNGNISKKQKPQILEEIYKTGFEAL